MNPDGSRDPGQDSELAEPLRVSFAAATLTVPLEATIRRGRRLRVRRRLAWLGGAVGAAVVAAAVVPLIAGGATTAGHRAQLAAWTVSAAPHGLVVVTVSQLKDPAGLQRALRAVGIPAAVRFQAAGTMSLTPPLPRVCADTGLSDVASANLQEKILPPPTALGNWRKTGPNTYEGPLTGVTMIIRPSAIPKGIGLNITVNWALRSWGWSLGLVKASPACTGN
jgi:hypothetical protein